jgi:16S rRNA (guanine527-N7)-methyltransferase
MELGLRNVQPVHARVETLAPQGRFDCLVCRAFASLPRILKLAGRLMNPPAVLLAMKGEVPLAELSALPAGYSARVLHLNVAIAQGRRHLVVISKTTP